MKRRGKARSFPREMEQKRRVRFLRVAFWSACSQQRYASNAAQGLGPEMRAGRERAAAPPRPRVNHGGNARGHLSLPAHCSDYYISSSLETQFPKLIQKYASKDQYTVKKGKNSSSPCQMGPNTPGNMRWLNDQPTWMANLDTKDSISLVRIAAAFVYCRSTFWSAEPRYAVRASGLRASIAAKSRAWVTSPLAAMTRNLSS